MATVLFLDIEGAFPTAVTDRLLHNLWTRQLPEPYVRFIEWMLTNQCTRLQFDRFTSDWVNIDNGIIQGDLLLMLLYLFYNANLIMAPKKEEAMIAYVDNASYYVEGANFEEVYDRLCDMMERAQGGFIWSDCHNSHFEPSKMVLAGFLRRRTSNPHRPGKLTPEPHPDLHLRSATIKPSPTHKYFGIIFNQELRWREQVECVMGTAAKWMLCFRRLTKPAFGICSRFMRQLYYAVAVPRFTYAADIWYAPVTRAVPDARASGSVGATKRLESIQCMAVMAITGALHTTAMDIMEAHANMLLVELLMHRVCHRAAVRLATLPDTHPLHKPVLTCACRWAKRHLSPIHLLLRAYKIKPAEFEAFSLANRPPNIKCVLTTDIAASRDSSKAADIEDVQPSKCILTGQARTVWPVPPPSSTKGMQSRRP